MISERLEGENRSKVIDSIPVPVVKLAWESTVRKCRNFVNVWVYACL